MNNIILKAENLSKQYRLGVVGTGTISHDLTRWWHRIRGKEDPFLKIGAVNDRSAVAKDNYVWALQDINFEVKKGEILGIIGKNGAGKSTLLKILSRVTSPTTGEIKTKGRIASLLEVGTGFHPELTGRENIYLNGAILGMVKSEIKNKEDEIIDFSGCQMYIDTPVKRYSSGMRVRLAFAVAAFLEPDILVIDEVLAVGDAEFQKKAIGKMQDISKGDGRTVLFVSHNMAAVKSLCTRTMVLRHGTIEFVGATDEALQFYLKESTKSNYVSYIKELVDANSDILEVDVLNEVEVSKTVFGFNDVIKFKLVIYISEKHIKKSVLGIRVKNKDEVSVFISQVELGEEIKEEGKHTFIISVPASLLAPNNYSISVGLHIPNQEVLSRLSEIMNFSVEETGSNLYKYQGKDIGCVIVDCDWTLQKTINNETT
ncbi:ABC transporter ATP-binding protein [Psychroserpens sp.]